MDWCTVCCTRHGSAVDCPGELLATGPERHGRRVTVAAHGRNEVYGALIAEAGKHWRARIVTYPNMLWSVPGQRATLKFVGGSAQDVETKAIAFILKLCAERQYKIVEQGDPPTSGAVEREDASVRSPQTARDERHLRSFDVSFGIERATEPGTTADLAKGGLFVVTRRRLAVGSQIRLRVDLERYSVPLIAEVAWVRRKAEVDRPQGMGVRLLNPPAIYLDFVNSIEKGSQQGNDEARDLQAETGPE